jgi:hypothetical protein
MSAFVVVAEHPYHTVTDTYGDYEIRDLPAGDYTLRVWHEVLGTVEQPLHVEAGRATAVDVTYQPPAAAERGSP